MLLRWSLAFFLAASAVAGAEMPQQLRGDWAEDRWGDADMRAGGTSPLTRAMR